MYRKIHEKDISKYHVYITTLILVALSVESDYHLWRMHDLVSPCTVLYAGGCALLVALLMFQKLVIFWQAVLITYWSKPYHQLKCFHIDTFSLSLSLSLSVCVCVCAQLCLLCLIWQMVVTSLGTLLCRELLIYGWHSIVSASCSKKFCSDYNNFNTVLFFINSCFCRSLEPWWVPFLLPCL